MASCSNEASWSSMHYTGRLKMTGVARTADAKYDEHAHTAQFWNTLIPVACAHGDCGRRIRRLDDEHPFITDESHSARAIARPSTRCSSFVCAASKLRRLDGLPGMSRRHLRALVEDAHGERRYRSQ